MELFAADGHDAGGCERVTGKSGMRPSEKSWYKTGNPDIRVANEDSDEVQPLSDYSPVIKQLKEAPHRQVRLYALPENADEGRRIVQEKLGGTS